MKGGAQTEGTAERSRRREPSLFCPQKEGEPRPGSARPECEHVLLLFTWYAEPAGETEAQCRAPGCGYHQGRRLRGQRSPELPEQELTTCTCGPFYVSGLWFRLPLGMNDFISSIGS